MLKEIFESKLTNSSNSVNEDELNYLDQFVVMILPEQKSAMLLSMFGFFTKYPVVKSKKELGNDLAEKIGKFNKDKTESKVVKVEIKEVEGMELLVLHCEFTDGKNKLKLKYTINSGNLKIVEE